MLYQRKTLADMLPVGEPGPIPTELRGLSDVSLANLDWTDAFLGYQGQGFFPVTVRNVTSIGFKQRLTAQERIAIRAAAVSDPVVADILDLIDTATLVDLDHADTVNGCAYLVSQDLLSAERVAEIRA